MDEVGELGPKVCPGCGILDGSEPAEEVVQVLPTRDAALGDIPDQGLEGLGGAEGFGLLIGRPLRHGTRIIEM
jgi:hypothetical protein